MNQFQGILPMVWDQGERNTCLSIALSDGHIVARKAGPHLAPEYLHFHASRRCGVGLNDAVTLDSGREALLADGQPEELACPYSPALRPRGWKLPKVHSPIWRHSTSLGSGTPRALVEKCLIAGASAALILRINDAFVRGAMAPSAIDVIAGVDRGYHAVLAVGFRDAPAAVLVRNCWGEGWSDSGYAWVADQFLAVRCSDIVTFSGIVT